MKFFLFAVFIAFATGFVHSDEKSKFKELAKIKSDELQCLIDKITVSTSKLERKIEFLVLELAYRIPYDENKFKELTKRLALDTRAANSKLKKATVGVDDLLKDIEEGNFDEERYEEIVKASNKVIEVVENAYDELEKFVDAARAETDVVTPSN